MERNRLRRSSRPLDCPSSTVAPSPWPALTWRSALARSMPSWARTERGRPRQLALLLGLLRPSAGRARIQGLDIVAHPIETKRRVGYLPEQVPLYGQLSGLENLELLRRPRRPAAHRWSCWCGSPMSGSPMASRPLASMYSRGDAAAGRAGHRARPRPAALLLDEPWNGLDPAGAAELTVRLRGAERKDGHPVHGARSLPRSGDRHPDWYPRRRASRGGVTATGLTDAGPRTPLLDAVRP